jgi:uncharacterized membrane protein YeaQ/YmgE (transglycosylase-associated protein family)
MAGIIGAVIVVGLICIFIAMTGDKDKEGAIGYFIFYVSCAVIAIILYEVFS